MIGFGGNGDQVRDVLHIADFVQLVLHVVEEIGTLAGQTFNVGGGRRTTPSQSPRAGWKCLKSEPVPGPVKLRHNSIIWKHRREWTEAYNASPF